ncbi:MAG: hypothetical protein LBU88_04695 [Treponema sp.]|jgi:hypothetical protein|nr:hypothetical protein [Treponema sp.]
MKKTFFGFIISLFVFFMPFAAAAQDFGLLLSQDLLYDNFSDDDNNVLTYTAYLIPRYSFFFGGSPDGEYSGSFTVNAGLGIQYKKEKFTFIPELLHTELYMRFGALGLSAGRIPYSDPLSYIFEGLFDGARITHTSNLGSFGFGIWYTGFLYKGCNSIDMTEEDRVRNAQKFYYDYISETYFAPSRLVASFDWEHPSVAELFKLSAAIIGQIDLSDHEEKFHSQYLTVKADIPLGRFFLEAGGSLQISQEPSKKTPLNLAFAGELGLIWFLPTDFNSRLSFAGFLAGGRTSDFMGAFVPITSKGYGQIIEPKMSAITALKLNYSARLAEKFGASVSASYFVRNDRVSSNNYTIFYKGGYFLGPEFYARVIWNPFSDLQLNLGGGIYLPSLGDAAPDANAMWNINLSVVFSIY